MYLILTSKPGQFTTELGEDIKPIEIYDYVLCGRKRAQFVIAEVLRETRIRVVEEQYPPVVNHVPAKFFPRFATVEGARQELHKLARDGTEITLVKR